MGFVFQQFNLLDEYSVLNNICMPLRLDGRKPDETFLAEVTKMLGIEEKLRKSTHMSFPAVSSSVLQ